MLRKICLAAAAIVVATLLGGSSCDGNDNGCMPGYVSSDCPAPQSPEPSKTPKAEKPLREILIEAGYSPRGYQVELDARGDSAIVTIPGVCTIDVVAWVDDTYQIVRVGKRTLSDLSESISDPLDGTNLSADYVEKTLIKAKKAGQLKGVC